MRTRAPAAVLVCAAAVLAQGPPENGPRRVDPAWFALTGGTVVAAPGEAPRAATVVFRDGVITAVGGEAPAGATIVDCTGLTLYPGLVEPFLPIDVPALDGDRLDAFWNPMVEPQRSALAGTGVPADVRRELWSQGFAVAAIAPSGGVLPGTGAVVLLDEASPTEPARVVRERAFLAAGLATGRDYPSSEMGAVALLRQTLLDGRWYERAAAAIAKDQALANRGPAASAALQALADTAALPLWFDTRNELQALRTLAIAAEMGRSAVVVGSGMEFRRLAALAAAKARIVVPLEFPDTPDVGTETAAGAVSLRQLQSWEQAPTNSKRLLDAGVEVAWTTARLRERKQFRERVRQAMACGIDEAKALAALTTTPAALLGIADRTGTLARGKLANVVAVQGSLFDPKAAVRMVWVGGRRHDVEKPKDAGLDGSWTLAPWPVEGAPRLVVDGDKVAFRRGEADCKATPGTREPDALSCRVADALGPDTGVLWLRVRRGADGGLAGIGTRPDGSTFAFAGTPGEPEKKTAKADEPPEAPPSLAPLATPLGGYGFTELPPVETFLITGATVWPCDGRPPIDNGAVLVRNGKIAFAGAVADLPSVPPGALQIDAAGKHVTPGIIDCHSHTGISGGVNEGGQAVTAEVRVADVIDPDAVAWYRELAGGVTAVNQLHGSANAIGGQSCTTKARYGVAHPDAMRLENAPAGIKFALGENPRRANGREASTRYPSTRMGVEALIRDRFAAAEAYRREQAGYEALTPQQRAAVVPPRRDLELEALAEVLAGTRRIHCHSYRQDEIFMLCNLAGEYGVEIGTFQHVLEGYKVADTIKAHAKGASSFSDWWAYKFEVYDAIPDNGAILHEAGVCVSFNSDSDEYARRLNTEAGKAVKYGGVAPADALCFVTRNPAIQLGIADRTGSLEPGKDADVALWSGNPLSYASRCEITWVDGRRMFSLARDRELRLAIATERARLLQRAAAAKKPAKRDDKDKAKDAYWAAEYQLDAYCCREHDGGAR
ncbi:MAG: amidohydrolase family protein [Planctomycetota bacterium]